MRVFSMIDNGGVGAEDDTTDDSAARADRLLMLERLEYKQDKSLYAAR